MFLWKFNRWSLLSIKEFNRSDKQKLLLLHRLERQPPSINYYFIPFINIKPTGVKCTECGACNKICPMDIDVMSYIKNGKKVNHSECILCTDCQVVCPVVAIK
ncbi:MAG: 4Fe-4S binding protein [Bacteroidetes bacterium]|nr:4Fe-4S binding protein [Bacteroidota bacterium]